MRTADRLRNGQWTIDNVEHLFKAAPTEVIKKFWEVQQHRSDVRTTVRGANVSMMENALAGL
jgi:hypothetical protein